MLVCDAASVARGREFAQGLGISHVVTLGPGGITIDELLAKPRCALPLPEPGDLSALFFTGGTTGLPKGANHTHDSLMAYCYGTVALWPLPLGQERILNVAPLFHIWGFCFHAGDADLHPRLHGSAAGLQAGRRAARIPRAQDHDIRRGPGCALPRAARQREFRQDRFSASRSASQVARPVRRSCCAAGRRQQAVSFWKDGACRRARRSIAIRFMACARSARSALSRLIPRLKLSTSKPANVSCRPAEQGEIRVRGPQFTKGYRNRLQENRQAIRHGWLYTGDIGYYDADGFLFLVDRKKEMIIVGGFNVYPREIDEVLFNHPAILRRQRSASPTCSAARRSKPSWCCVREQS